MGTWLALLAALQLNVFAAASLREVFQELAASFEQSHAGASVIFNFAGSQELRTQIEHGARADVMASADAANMRPLVEAKLAGEPRVFARNEPVIVLAKGNPAQIHSLADLPRARRLVIGTPEVPIGAYTIQILDAASRRQDPGFRAAVEAKVVSRELNVRQVLAKVVLGEADAGIVYRTDAISAKGGVEIVSIPPELNVVAEYPVAVLRGAPNPELAQDFVELLVSEKGRAALARYGFK